MRELEEVERKDGERWEEDDQRVSNGNRKRTEGGGE